MLPSDTIKFVSKNVVMPLLSSKMSTRSVKFPSRTQSRNFNRQTINKFRNRSAFRHLNQLQYHIELHHGIPNRTRAPRALRRQNCRRHRYNFLNNLKAKNFMFWMKFSFELVTQNKIVVSGAASGIGLATSVAFLMEGAAKVALVRKKATTKHDFELQIWYRNFKSKC